MAVNIRMANLKPGHGLDAAGHIISDVGLDKVDGAFWPCIQNSVETLTASFSRKLHSVYLYGSVARGDATLGRSDLDLLAVFQTKLSSAQTEQLKIAAQTLSCGCRALVREVGIASVDLEHVLDPVHYYEGAFLKEFCVCVHGAHLRERFGPYTLSYELAASFNGDMAAYLPRALGRLAHTTGGEFDHLVQACARKFVRTCYMMAMVRSQVWTTRLDEQTDVFSQYFPSRQAMVRALSAWIEQPPSDRDGVVSALKRWGGWIQENFDREASKT